MIPKNENPTSPTEFRPISIANELYKIITRIITTRLKPLMSSLIHPSQSAFIPGISLSDNILLANDLVRGFHLGKGQARMCLKLDLSKAFDNVSWDFLKSAMEFLNLPS